MRKSFEKLSISAQTENSWSKCSPSHTDVDNKANISIAHVHVIIQLKWMKKVVLEKCGLFALHIYYK